MHRICFTHVNGSLSDPVKHMQAYKVRSPIGGSGNIKINYFERPSIFSAFGFNFQLLKIADHPKALNIILRYFWQLNGSFVTFT
jgi:hypothetical protein